MISRHRIRNNLSQPLRQLGRISIVLSLLLSSLSASDAHIGADGIGGAGRGALSASDRQSRHKGD